MIKRRILLVDDEIPILLTLKAVLELNGFTVDTATSGRDARVKLKSAEYAMVITDMRMESDSAGLDVVKMAKAAPNNPAVAILTAFPVEGEDWLAQGADEMLVKPMNVQALVSQMELLLVAHEDKKQKAEALATATAASSKSSAVSAAKR